MCTTIKSSRLNCIPKKKRSLWKDSETDLSSASDRDSDTRSSQTENGKTSNDESTTSSNRNCCLVCSILSSLSSVNCCQKHLTLLTDASPTQITCITPSRVKTWPRQIEDHQRKHRCRSSSTKSRNWREKRSVTLTSFSTAQTDDFLLSPNRERSSSPSIDSPRRSNHLLSPLHESTMNNNHSSSRKRHRTLSSSFVTKQKRQNIVPRVSTPQMNHASTSTDVVELDSVSPCSPRILLKRVIHVKDDDEELIVNPPQIILNMTQATQQMTVQSNSRPRIILKRVHFEQ